MHEASCVAIKQTNTEIERKTDQHLISCYTVVFCDMDQGLADQGEGIKVQEFDAFSIEQ